LIVTGDLQKLPERRTHHAPLLFYVRLEAAIFKFKNGQKDISNLPSPVMVAREESHPRSTKKMAKKEEGKPVVDPDAVDEVLVRLRLISDLVNTADAIVDLRLISAIVMLVRNCEKILLKEVT
jgi:hypothetical protein